ncbi:hypothetical protein PG990_011582 [Apiospora arundinis]
MLMNAPPPKTPRPRRCGPSEQNCGDHPYGLTRNSYGTAPSKSFYLLLSVVTEFGRETVQRPWPNTELIVYLESNLLERRDGSEMGVDQLQGFRYGLLIPARNGLWCGQTHFEKRVRVGAARGEGLQVRTAAPDEQEFVDVVRAHAGAIEQEFVDAARAHAEAADPGRQQWQVELRDVYDEVADVGGVAAADLPEERVDLLGIGQLEVHKITTVKDDCSLETNDLAHAQQPHGGLEIPAAPAPGVSPRVEGVCVNDEAVFVDLVAEFAGKTEEVGHLGTQSTSSDWW